MHIIVFLFAVFFFISESAFGARKTCEDSFVQVVAQAKTESRFELSNVQVGSRRVFYEVLPAKNGKGTAVIFNGLFVPNFNFAEFKSHFEAKSDGEGLILFSYSVGVESLMVANLVDGSVKANLTKRTTKDFADEGFVVVEAAGVRGPLFPIGYSYGSSTAGEFTRSVLESGKYSIGALIYVGPLVTAGEHNTSLLNSKFAMNAMTAYNPLGRMFANGLMDATERSTATQFVAGVFTGDLKIPDGITRENIIDGVVLQMAAARDFDLRTTEHPPVRTEFLVGEKENEGRLELQKEVFTKVAVEAEARGEVPGSFTVIPDAEHTAILTHPQQAVAHILKIMRENTTSTVDRRARPRSGPRRTPRG